MQIYLLRVLLWETSIRKASGLQSWGIIDPKSVPNDLRQSISPAALYIAAKGAKLLKKKKLILCIQKNKNRNQIHAVDHQTVSQSRVKLHGKLILK